MSFKSWLLGDFLGDYDPEAAANYKASSTSTKSSTSKSSTSSKSSTVDSYSALQNNVDWSSLLTSLNTSALEAEQAAARETNAFNAE